MTQLQIKNIQKINIQEIIEIEKEAFPNHHWSKDSFENEIVNKLAIYRYVVNQDNVIEGYYGFWHIIDEAHITTLAVHPQYRRKGVAAHMLLNLIDECYKRMIKYITLEVRISNVPAISLYEKFGFSTIGTRKKYYQDNNEDALIMFTENIWYDKFKNNYKELKEKYNRKYK